MVADLFVKAERLHRLLYIAGAAVVYECGDGRLVHEEIAGVSTWLGAGNGCRSPAYPDVERAMAWVAEEERVRRAG